MSSIVISGDTSGSVTLQAPAVAGSTVLNLPSTSGTIQTSGAGYTTNGVAYATSTSALATGSALTFDGANNFLLDATGTGGNQANLRVKTDTGGAVANGYFNINGTDYFRIYTTNSETGLRNLQNTPMFFSINNTEQMRLTSTGLGIGTSSPGTKLQVAGGARIGSASGTTFSGALTTSGLDVMVGSGAGPAGAFQVWDDNVLSTPRFVVTRDGNAGVNFVPNAWSVLGSGIQFKGGGSVVGRTDTVTQTNYTLNGYFNGTDWKYIESTTATRYMQYVGAHTWHIAPSGTAGNNITWTQAATLAADGSYYVGCTTTPDGTSGGSAFYTQSVGRRTLRIACTTSGGAGLAEFVNSNGLVGTISTSGSATTYGTSSDYRLKNSIAPMTGALAKVALLKPVTYKWNADDSDGEGFIAHELAEVCPDAVTGTKDAVDEDGNPVYQGIDTSFLVATLTAALQEQQALINTLTDRITALEGV